MSKRQETIAEFMSICSGHKYTFKDVAIIESGYKRYLWEQRKKGVKSGRTQKDFEQNNIILSERLYGQYTPDQVKLYKRSVHLLFDKREVKVDGNE